MCEIVKEQDEGTSEKRGISIMAKFNDVEKQLMERITNDRLRDSLALLRQAAEDIWAADSPHIVQDFTSHGIDHSERLASFAAKLLENTDGRALSSLESYILLAGIYLHDIGMKCDVIKFSEIKKNAEKLGAKFDVEFNAETSSGYNIDEQKEIRKNHQYLSAAWIDYAKRTGDTFLGPAAKQIPPDLVSDLMDVCKYHSKLPITECPITFKSDPNERKQLVAALLRFSDELDIDKNRVTLETVKNFRLDPNNAVYWWLHNCTKLVISDHNAIILIIQLSPVDKERYGSLVHTAFITNFQTKNQQVINILRQNVIPVSISLESGVEENSYSEQLPQEIARALESMDYRSDPLRELADDVCTWLKAIQYEVTEPEKYDDRTIEFIATLDLGTLKQRVRVRCIEGEIGPQDVNVDGLDLKIPQGWFISDARVSPQARDKAAEHEALDVFNLSEFMQQKVWRSYFDHLKSLVEKDRIPDLYVDLECYRQSFDEKISEPAKEVYNSLDRYIDGWLKERGKVHISLLGDFGAGKTWFCRHYAYRQLQRYVDNPIKERLPLLITLRTFAKAMNSKQLINDALLEQYKLQFVGSPYNIFQEMSRQGKLLLILDGFDEMARQVDYQTVVDNFWQLAELVDENSKVILTSRTEYFRWAKESEKILGGEEYGTSTIELSPPKFEVLYLKSFNDDQIRKVIKLRLGEEAGDTVADRILGTPNLADMARKPVLIELLLAALDEVSADVLENPAQVYLYATNKLLLRNINTQRTFTTISDKLYFLCELAWEMIKSEDLRIHYKDVPERIKSYFKERSLDQHELDTWDFDLRSQTLLHRDAAGYYEFAHKSLAEYFVAYKFAAELGCLATEFTSAYCEADGKPCQVLIEKNGNELAKTFGLLALNDQEMWTLSRFLIEMISDNAQKKLWNIINETKGNAPEAVNYNGSNAIKLLLSKGESLKGADLEQAVLTNVSLYNIDLTNANLRATYLNKASLINVNLENTDCRLANFTDAEIREIHYGSSLTWSDSGLFLAFIHDSSLSIFNIRDYSEVLSLPLISYSRFDQVAQFMYNKICLLFGNRNKLMSSVFKENSWHTHIESEFDHDIGCIALNRENELVALHQRDKILIWNTQNHSIYRTIDANIDTHSLLFIPNSNLLVAAHPVDYSRSGHLISCSGAGRRHLKAGFKVWDIILGKLVYEFNFSGYSWERCNFDVDSLGQKITTAAFDKKLMIWSLPTFEVIEEVEPEEVKEEKSFNWGRHAVAFNPDGTKIAVSGSSVLPKISLIDANSGRTMFEIKNVLDTRISSIAFSPDGHYLATTGYESDSVRIWDVNSKNPTFGQCIKLLKHPLMNCNGMQVGGAVSLDQKLLKFLAERGAILDQKQKEALIE